MSSASIRRSRKRKVRFMKKELIITDLMDSRLRHSRGLSYIKK